MLGGSHQQREGASAALLIISHRDRVMEGGPDLGQSWAGLLVARSVLTLHLLPAAPASVSASTSIRTYVHTSSTYKQACVCVSRLALPARTGGDHTRPAVESRFTPPTIPVVGSSAGASGMLWTPGRRDAGLFFFASCATRPGRDDRSTSRRHTMRTHHHHYHLR